MNRKQAVFKLEGSPDVKPELPSFVEVVAPLGGGRALVSTYRLAEGGDSLQIEAHLTEAELDHLFRYLAEEVRSWQRFCAAVPGSGSHKMQMLSDASCRMGYYWELLGDERARAILDDVFRDFPSEEELAEERENLLLTWHAKDMLGKNAARAIRRRAWAAVPTHEELEALCSAARQRECDGYRAALAAAGLADTTEEPEQPAYE
jgi:hypothetical protein